MRLSDRSCALSRRRAARELAPPLWRAARELAAPLLRIASIVGIDDNRCSVGRIVSAPSDRCRSSEANAALSQDRDCSESSETVWMSGEMSAACSERRAEGVGAIPTDG